MLDIIGKLKEYKSLIFNQKNETESKTENNTENNLLSLPINESTAGILSPMAEDLRKMAKNQFKMEQQLEGCFDEIEEISQILKEELKLKETYQEALSIKDELIQGIKQNVQQKEEQIQNLVLALVNFSDHFELIYGAILASGEQEWQEQMGRVKSALSLTMQKNFLSEIGHEKYFNDQLHQVFSLVEDEQRDFREITGIVQKGYLYHGNVFRKAQVTVNNHNNHRDNIL